MASEKKDGPQATSSNGAANSKKQVEYDPYKEVKAKGEQFHLSSLVFKYAQDPAGQPELRQDILRLVEAAGMGPYYEELAKRFEWPVDAALVEKFAAANAARVTALQATLADAVANLGQAERFDAAVALVEHYASVGDKAGTLAACDKAQAEALSAGQKIDITLSKARCALFFGDQVVLKEVLEKAAALVEEGGDWDRRNRLQVYQGTQAVLARDFKRASELFLASLATFTCFELHAFEHFVFLTVVVSALSLGRPDLKAKVIDSPEILAVASSIPHASAFVNSLYDCEYKRFMEAVVDLHGELSANQFLSAHVDFVLRESRVLAYTQFLQSYKSVTMSSMAEAFGLSEDFLDQELSRFIAVKRLSARIDKVGGIVETCRPDTKNAQYQSIIKDGDLLLNRIQKLSRVISV
jgi:26S proteasome regulatory subunit N7